MRAQHLLNARQPANELRRVLCVRSFVIQLFNFQPISELSPRTAKIFSSAKPDFPTEKHTSCRFILFSFLRFFNRTKLSQTNEKKINLLFVSQCFSVVFDLSESLKTDNDSFTFHSRSKL